MKVGGFLPRDSDLIIGDDADFEVSNNIDVQKWTRIVLILTITLATLNGVDPSTVL